VKPENARALAPPIIEAIKGGHDSNQRHALGLALAAAATQLKPEEADALDRTIAEAIQDTDEHAPGASLGDALNQGSRARRILIESAGDSQGPANQIQVGVQTEVDSDGEALFDGFARARDEACCSR
jgi:hypothetical protein